MNLDQLARRRDLLVAQAELDRIELSLALRDVRRSVASGGGKSGALPGFTPILLRALVGVLPAIALVRFRRIVATVSATVAIVRALQAWRSRAR